MGSFNFAVADAIIITPLHHAPRVPESDVRSRLPLPKKKDLKLTSDNRSYIDDYKTHHLVYKNPAFDLRAMPIHGYLNPQCIGCRLLQTYGRTDADSSW